MLVFEERGKLEYQEEKPLGAKERTNNRLNPHMASTPGFEPGPHWWEVSALTTAPSLAPHLSISSTDSVRMGLNPASKIPLPFLFRLGSLCWMKDKEEKKWTKQNELQLITRFD